MGIVESVRAVRWAPELLDRAVAGERAGFDLICCSDHPG
jgi:hypothetical protein